MPLVEFEPTIPVFEEPKTSLPFYPRYPLHRRFGGPQNGLKNKEEFIIKKCPASVYNKERIYYNFVWDTR
jgi:hypothetical protein